MIWMEERSPDYYLEQEMHKILWRIGGNNENI